jgi:large subunit ribosomal protein L9
MKVILQHDVVGLGEEGDVCEVATGYARNFLFRTQAALPFTGHAMNLMEHRRDGIERRKEDKRTGAAGLRERLENEELTFRMTAGASGKLFGSITSVAIAGELDRRGFDVDRRRIEVPDHSLKMIGEHTVRIRLYENQSANVQVVIEADQE